MIRKCTTEIAVTTHRFVEKKGLVHAQDQRDRLAQHRRRQRYPELLGPVCWAYGHLRIEGTGVDAVDLPDIADPVAFRAAIETAKSARRRAELLRRACACNESRCGRITPCETETFMRTLSSLQRHWHLSRRRPRPATPPDGETVFARCAICQRSEGRTATGSAQICSASSAARLPRCRTSCIPPR